MNPVVTTRLVDAMLLTEALVDSLSESALELRNGSAPSNIIGGQFWCVVGARESYARAIARGQWSGFSCSLAGAEARQREKIRSSLARARTELLEVISSHEATDQRVAIVLEVLEHEALHHGQLIRYFYANGLPFPTAFARRYALAQPKGKKGATSSPT